MKRELVYPIGRFATRDDARVAVFEYTEVYYNRERLHSSLDYETPDIFELSQQQKKNQEVRDYWNEHKHPYVWGRRRRHRSPRKFGVATLPTVSAF